MKFAFGFAILAFTLPNNILCCKTLEEIDTCAYEISFLENRGISVPTDDAGVTGMCARNKAGIKCLKDEATACMPGPMKAITIKILGDMEDHLNTRCDSPPHRAEFLKHIQCFTDPAKAEAIRLCADKHMVMMEKVSNMPKELRLGGSCCSSHGMRDCIIGQIRAQCSGETGDYFNDMIQEATEEKMQMICSQYATMEKCDANFDAATWTDLKGILASSDVSALKNHKYKTVLPVIIKMMKEGAK